MKKLFMAAVAALAAPLALAQASPVGLWRSIDDNTKQERSLVRITESNGVLSGKIEKIADPAKQDARCTKCEDDRKNQPILGMTILRDLKKGDDGAWDGGNILDPDNGKIYRATVKPIEGGKQLQLRGYIGPFFRTQVWIRAD